MGDASTGIVSLVLRTVGLEVGRALAQRSKLWLMKRGKIQDYTPFIRVNEAALAGIADFSAFAVVERLPRSVTHRTIKKIIEGPVFKAAAIQIIASAILQSTTTHENRAIDALRAEFAAHLPDAKASDLAEYFEAFTNLLRTVCSEITLNLLRAPQDTGARIDWARGILLDATLETLTRAVTSPSASDPHVRSIRQAWLYAYQEEFNVVHSRISVPDMEMRRVVPADELFVPPRFGIDFGIDPIVEFDNIIDLVDRAVWLGDPGAGKSTASEQLAVRWNQTRPAFYLRMREVRIDSAGFDLVREIEHVCRTRYQLPAPDGAVEELLTSGNALVVLDAFDEVGSAAKRLLAVQAVESASRRFPMTSFLATAREIGYSATRLDDSVFTVYRIQPFDQREVIRYAHRWFSVASPGIETAGAFTADFIREGETIADLCSNPLLLSFICVLYRKTRYIPRNRPKIYEGCVELLLEAWDKVRAVALEDEVSVNQVPLDSYSAALTRVSSKLYTDDGKLGLPEAELTRTIYECLVEEAVPDQRSALKLAAEITNRCRGRAWIFTDIGIGEDGQDLFSFTHRSFLEYFYALYLWRTTSSPEDLAACLVEFILSGRGEVLLQTSMRLTANSTRGGASRLLLRLLDLLGPRPSSSVLEFLISAADVAMLNEEALRSLVAKSVDALLEDHTGRLGWRLMDRRFRHATSVHRLLVESLAPLEAARVKLLLLRNDWLFELCLRRGAFSIQELFDLIDQNCTLLIRRLVFGSLATITGDGSYNTARWLLEKAIEPGSQAASWRNLAQISRCISDPSTIFGVSIDSRPSALLEDYFTVCEIIDRAMDKAVGRGPDTLSAIVLFGVVWADLGEAWIPSYETRALDGFVGRLLSARLSGDDQLVRSGNGLVLDTYRSFVKSWIEGRSLFYWPEIEGTVVS